MRIALVLLLSSSLPVLAQSSDAAETPALPAAGTPAATQLVDTAIAKMLAVGRGTFKTSEGQDSALMRNAGMPFGRDDTEVEGGWSQDMVWGDSDGDPFVRRGGRMVAKVGDAWKLRGKKLASGRDAPFTLDPDLLFTALRELPAAARTVVHAEAGEVAGKPVAILSLTLEDEVASEFADSGTVPGAGGGFGGGMLMFGGPGGGQAPQADYRVDVALFIDPSNGDVLRFSAKVFEKNAMFGNIQIQVQGRGGDEEAEEEVEEANEKAAPDAGKLVWKKGLPVRKPAKDESVMTFRADFKQLGLAEPPSLDEKAKALLRMR